MKPPSADRTTGPSAEERPGEGPGRTETPEPADHADRSTTGAAARPLLRALPSVHELTRHPLIVRLIEDWGRTKVLDWIRDEAATVREWIRNAASKGTALNSLRDALDRVTGETVRDAVPRGLSEGTPAAYPDESQHETTPHSVSPRTHWEQWKATLLERIVDGVRRRADSAELEQLGRVINATGVVLHTGLGRAPLSAAAVAAVQSVAGAANVEFDLQTGTRRTRGFQLTGLLTTLTAAEDALIVNNNAAATLLTLQALCSGREVVISRGQLIEIGGSFRLPEIFELSGAVLREVGTTNRTRVSDYERAIGPQTAAILHVHTSNYRVVGFAETPAIEELVRVAHRHGLLAIDDIGSGCLVDLPAHGLPAEPTFARSIAAGADLVLGSGDKLLGGPQAGIIVGRSRCVQMLRQHPLARCVRIDKLTLAALAATLETYVRGTYAEELPLFRLLLTPQQELLGRAEAIVTQVRALPKVRVAVRRDVAPVGGGSLPGCELPTAVIALRHAVWPAAQLARRLRTGRVRIVPRIADDEVLIDLRSVPPEQDDSIVLALRLLAAATEPEQR
ncbi:MAG: L-seryl-tRNA(Sec) selenium transferase [Planctomycetota bacterium]|nr:MAG: L-seryl-tRNA(Sec) selenium transferase [Planctomycetota bacterium]